MTTPNKPSNYVVTVDVVGDKFVVFRTVGEQATVEIFESTVNVEGVLKLKQFLQHFGCEDSVMGTETANDAVVRIAAEIEKSYDDKRDDD